MWEVVARKCSAKKLLYKFHKIHTEIPVLESLSNIIKGLPAIRLWTLLKRDPRTGVSEPALCRSSTKSVFLNNLQNLHENTRVGVSF